MSLIRHYSIREKRTMPKERVCANGERFREVRDCVVLALDELEVPSPSLTNVANAKSHLKEAQNTLIKIEKETSK